MAYSGYLIQIGNDYQIPMRYMNEKTYKCTFSTMDVDSYRDANGVLHRNAISKVPHCSFTTRALTNADVQSLWSNISSRYTNAMEKKVTASVYIPETDSYYTGSFYVPDTDMTIHHISGNTVRKNTLTQNAVKHNTSSNINVQYKRTEQKDYVVYYEPITFEFIGYGG